MARISAPVCQGLYRVYMTLILADNQRVTYSTTVDAKSPDEALSEAKLAAMHQLHNLLFRETGWAAFVELLQDVLDNRNLIHDSIGHRVLWKSAADAYKSVRIVAAFVDQAQLTQSRGQWSMLNQSEGENSDTEELEDSEQEEDEEEIEEEEIEEMSELDDEEDIE